MPCCTKLTLDIRGDGSLRLSSENPHRAVMRIAAGGGGIPPGWTNKNYEENNQRCLDDLDARLARCSTCKELTINTRPQETSGYIIDRLCDIFAAWKDKISRACLILVHHGILSRMFGRFSREMVNWECKNLTLEDVTARNLLA
jgi:hypothetical protein